MIDQKREVADLMKLLADFVEEQNPFNKALGLRVESLEMDSICLKIEMKEELVGNPVKWRMESCFGGLCVESHRLLLLDPVSVGLRKEINDPSSSAKAG